MAARAAIDRLFRATWVSKRFWHRSMRRAAREEADAAFAFATAASIRSKIALQA